MKSAELIRPLETPNPRLVRFTISVKSVYPTRGFDDIVSSFPILQRKNKRHAMEPMVTLSRYTHPLESSVVFIGTRDPEIYTRSLQMDRTIFNLIHYRLREAYGEKGV